MKENLVYLNFKNTSTIIDFINSAQEDLNIEDVNQLIDILAHRKEELKTVRFNFNSMLKFKKYSHKALNVFVSNMMSIIRETY